MEQPIELEIRIELEPIGKETALLAEQELRETPERVKEATDRLRELLRQEKTIYFRDDDEFLLIFLRPCKYYPESALKVMIKIAEFKKDNAHLLDNLMPEQEKLAFLEHNVVNVLKNRDHKGRRVMIVNVGAGWDPKRVDSDRLFRLFYLIHEMAMLEPTTQVRGAVVLMDFDGMGFKQVLGLSPAFSKRLLTFIQDAMPMRLKEVHFVKQPWIFSKVWAMFKPFIREKLANRIHFHKDNMASLHEFMAPSHLPSDYGGKLPKIDYQSRDWYPILQDQHGFIEKWNTYGFTKSA